MYEQRWKHISSKFINKEVYAGEQAQQYLDKLTDEIIRADPAQLRPNTFGCYFSRSGVPNGSYIGQGIILFNMRLQKELRSANI